MTPKDKAQELANKFHELDPDTDCHNGIYWRTAKKCALIAVDELLDAFHQMGMYRECAYWQQVGQEIENL